MHLMVTYLIVYIFYNKIIFRAQIKNNYFFSSADAQTASNFFNEYHEINVYPS